jgi:ubiquinone/menaquinone biosynthesis C-methylase UbiE
MDTLEQAGQKAAATYNAAADYYDHPVNAFWERYGRRSVEHLRLAPGASVLDVCCGSGASALPAAEAVGPGGSVLGIDLADNLLALARAKAEARGLQRRATFRAGNMLDPGLPSAAFDAVICVFGIFFVPDMPRAVERLWRLIRPGGQLAITTWGTRFLEPVNAEFWNAVRDERPDLYKGFNPWDRISEPQGLRDILTAAGVQQAEIVAEPGTQALAAPEDWWPIVMGTGYRGTIEQLDRPARERVRTSCLDFIRATGTRSVETNIVRAIARKNA